MIISKSHCRAGRRPLVHSISVRLSDKVIFVVWNTDLKSLSYFQRNETRLTSNERSNPDNNKKKNNTNIQPIRETREHNSYRKRKYTRCKLKQENLKPPFYN